MLRLSRYARCTDDAIGDGTTEGKVFLSEDQLTDTLNGMLREYEDTENFEFRGVQWHELDADGCNCESTYVGGDVSEYVIEVARQVEARARELYNLAE